ncbi:hypothetical protein B0J15DRAFT_48456 [Fusarium solani]|jgi:hypothetical protein|uniref:Uncharacterized protein n=1 Tax=Fusarium solani TaxID=169388 RepID=A0A9P9KF92_FUSSL|nr:uncharacterized protein B0J15DRAFT_48456 [Fusarium solani]KAH7250739.1 hypothetical protein B0J15DRAFT_48456 [Fusarium solani]
MESLPLCWSHGALYPSSCSHSLLDEARSLITPGLTAVLAGCLSASQPMPICRLVLRGKKMSGPLQCNDASLFTNLPVGGDEVRVCTSSDLIKKPFSFLLGLRPVRHTPGLPPSSPANNLHVVLVIFISSTGHGPFIFLFSAPWISWSCLQGQGIQPGPSIHVLSRERIST